MSDKCADAIFGLWVLRSYLLRLCLRCVYNVFVLRLLGRLLLMSGTSICVLQISVRMRHVMFSIIYLSENIEFGIKQVLLVVLQNTLFQLFAAILSAVSGRILDFKSLSHGIFFFSPKRPRRHFI